MISTISGANHRIQGGFPGDAAVNAGWNGLSIASRKSPTPQLRVVEASFPSLLEKVPGAKVQAGGVSRSLIVAVAGRCNAQVMSMTPATILLVDNDPGLLGLLTLELEQEGYQVQSYASAEDALAAGLKPPALAILDYHLPGMNGLAFLERLRQSYPSLPVLMISSECTLGYPPSRAPWPVTGLLRKPFSYHDFRQQVITLLRREAGP